MNYRVMIKRRFPALGSMLRRHPKLMSLALKAESVLLILKMRRQNKLLGLNKTGASLNIHETELLKKAKEAGFFDYNWYCQNQNKVFQGEQHAFRDYLNKSRFSGVSPSPAFNNLNYLKQNLDVYHQGLSPLAHYLVTGKDEGRVVQSFNSKWHPSDEIQAQVDKALLSKQKIAVCLHIFYEDFIDYYASCLESFPVAVDLFISVSNGTFNAGITSKLAALPTVNSVVVKEVPNRGRNFGPMLVEFGQELLNYDLFCHLHSKKSLYSGRQQTQWADYLGEYLLNDKQVVAEAICYMASQPDCGVYYPSSFCMMPDWVNHWLKNKPFRERYFQEWGIQSDKDFDIYPVGGMFWAKPKALHQLLQKKYSYEDFPSEPLPNDGSELHALERCIGLLAEANGYSQLFYYPELGRFTADKSFIFSNYVNSAEEVFYKLLPFNIISFDVFDTLVRRSYHVPDYAKLKLGQHLAKQGVVDTPQVFVTARNEAEFNIRKSKKFQGDVSITEVYQQLATDLNLSDAEAKEFSELEFAYDLEMIESKDEMVDILNNLILQGKDIYIISDTYYTEHQIVLMLRKAGVTNGYKLFVSSELGMRKDNGTMWSYIKDKVSGKGAFVHVGDNVVADAQIPGDFGLANLHILNPADKWQAAGWSNPLAGSDQLDEDLILKWGPLISQFGRYPYLGE